MRRCCDYSGRRGGEWATRQDGRSRAAPLRSKISYKKSSHSPTIAFAMVCLTRVLIVVSLLAASAPVYAESEPISLKIFGRPMLGSTGMCTMGWSAESIKKLEKQQEFQKTLSYWCKQNRRAIMPKFRRVFKDHPVSYKVSFEGKSDTGLLRPTAHFSIEAENAAMEILKKELPFTTPPTDLPYSRGLLIRFTSTEMTVALASRKF